MNEGKDQAAPSLPAPPAQQADAQRRSAPHGPTREKCLAALHQLAGAVLLGVVTPAQANSARSCYTALLQYSEAGQGQAVIENASLRALLATNPEILSSIQHLLTDEQIALLASPEWNQQEST